MPALAVNVALVCGAVCKLICYTSFLHEMSSILNRVFFKPAHRQCFYGFCGFIAIQCLVITLKLDSTIGWDWETVFTQVLFDM
jgi:hypothetical protein